MNEKHAPVPAGNKIRAFVIAVLLMSIVAGVLFAPAGAVLGGLGLGEDTCPSCTYDMGFWEFIWCMIQNIGCHPSPYGPPK